MYTKNTYNWKSRVVIDVGKCRENYRKTKYTKIALNTLTCKLEIMMQSSWDFFSQLNICGKKLKKYIFGPF